MHKYLIVANTTQHKTAPGVFKAAVQIVGVIDWHTFMARADAMLRAYIVSLLGDPERDRAAYASAGPITYIDNIDVPLLSLAGERDIRVPPEQAVQVGKALKDRGVVSDTIIYPSEGHVFLKHETQIDELRRTLDWFNRYLIR